ncbi:MAG: right-handed parallel beta-helix repeat-containing protein, partial [Planctomycetota bacterium]
PELEPEGFLNILITGRTEEVGNELDSDEIRELTLTIEDEEGQIQDSVRAISKLFLEVNDIRDVIDANPQDNIPDTDPDTPGLQISLREAITVANALTVPTEKTIRKVDFFLNAPNLRQSMEVDTDLGPLPELTSNVSLLAGANALRIVGNTDGETIDGLRVNGDNVTVSNVEIREFTGNGLTVQGSGNTLSKIQVGDPNRFDGPQSRLHGILLQGVTDLTLEDVEVTQNLEDGLRIVDSSNVNVRSISSVRNSQFGVLIRDSRQVTIRIEDRQSESQIVQNSGVGLRIESESNPTNDIHIEGLFVSDNGPTDSDLSEIEIVGPGVSNVTLNENTLGGSDIQSKFAISISDASEITISENDLEGDDAIVVSNATQVDVIGNEIQGGRGVVVSGNSDAVGIVANEFESEINMPIDLVSPGEAEGASTANDAGDADSGPNQLQNFPELTVFSSRSPVLGNVNGSLLAIQLELDSTPSSLFQVQLYAGGPANQALFADGATTTFLMRTDASGNARRTITTARVFGENELDDLLPTTPFQAVATRITGAGTSLSRTTSELSPPVRAQLGSDSDFDGVIDQIEVDGGDGTSTDELDNKVVIIPALGEVLDGGLSDFEIAALLEQQENVPTEVDFELNTGRIESEDELMGVGVGEVFDVQVQGRVFNVLRFGELVIEPENGQRARVRVESDRPVNQVIKLDENGQAFVFDFDPDTQTGAQFSADRKEVILNLRDNQRGDLDPREGVIRDPFSPVLIGGLTLPRSAAGRDVTLKRNGDALEIIDNPTTEVIQSQLINDTNLVFIDGFLDAIDHVAIDLQTEGGFNLADPIIVDGEGGDDLLRITQGGTANFNLSDAQQIVFDAGTGLDTLQFEGNSPQIDLTQLGAGVVQNLETLRLATTEGAGSLAISPQVVSDITDENQELTLESQFGDEVFLGEGWNVDGFEVVDGKLVRILKNNDVTLRSIGPSDWTNPVDRFDVNANGEVSALDALLIINELNRDRLLDAEGNLPPAVQDGVFTGQFLDVLSRGTFSALDALNVINHINRLELATSTPNGEPLFENVSDDFMPPSVSLAEQENISRAIPS